jgi:hypothetical protein
LLSGEALTNNTAQINSKKWKNGGYKGKTFFQ